MSQLSLRIKVVHGKRKKTEIKVVQVLSGSFDYSKKLSFGKLQMTLPELQDVIENAVSNELKVLSEKERRIECPKR